MKGELLKSIITGLLELFTFGLYLDSGLDSLVAEMKRTGLEIEANQMVQLYYATLAQEHLQSMIAVFSVAFLVIINLDRTVTACFKLFRGIKWLWFQGINKIKLFNKNKKS